MPIASLGAKALIAIAAVAMLWPKSPPRLKKVLILLMATLWIVSAILDIAQERKTTDEQVKISRAQSQMADALKVLKMNSEQDKKAKEIETQRRQEIVSRLTVLMNEGIRARNECRQPQSHAEQVWTNRVESQLHTINSSDEAAFESSQAPLICFQSMSIKLEILQHIIDRYNKAPS